MVSGDILRGRYRESFEKAREYSSGLLGCTSVKWKRVAAEVLGLSAQAHRRPARTIPMACGTARPGPQASGWGERLRPETAMDPPRAVPRSSVP